jgi:hypothetical protein
MSLDKHVNVLCGKFRLNLKLFQRRTNSEKTAWSFHLYVEREKTIFAPVLLTVHSFIYPHMRWLTANTHSLSLSDVHTQILSSLRSIATRPRRTSGRKLETLSHYHQHLRVCDRERKRKREREKENYWFWPLAFPRSTVLFSSIPHPFSLCPAEDDVLAHLRTLKTFWLIGNWTSCRPFDRNCAKFTLDGVGGAKHGLKCIEAFVRYYYFFFRFGFCLARSSGKISLSVWFQPAFSSVSLKVQN